MSDKFKSAFIGCWAGFFIGMTCAAIAEGQLDCQAIERGWMDHRGSIYLIVPAKAVPSP
jgi:hypothetical protein